MAGGSLAEQNVNIEFLQIKIENFHTSSSLGDQKPSVSEVHQLASDIATCLNAGVTAEKMAGHIRAAVWKRPETAPVFREALQKAPSLIPHSRATPEIIIVQSRFAEMDTSALKGTVWGRAAVNASFPFRHSSKVFAIKLRSLFGSTMPEPKQITFDPDPPEV